MGEAALVLKPEDIQVEQSPIVATAKALTVTSSQEVEAARDMIRQIKDRRKKIDDTFDEHIKAAHQAHKALVAKKKSFTDELDEAERVVKGSIGKYELEQLRIREEQERKAREDAERERQKLLNAAKAKIDRITGSVDKIEIQITGLQQIVSDPASSELEVEMASRQIEVLKLKLEGQQERAAQVQQEAEAAAFAAVPVTPAATASAKVSGVSSKIVLIPTINDPLALIKAIADGKAPPTLIKEWDMTALKKLVNMGMKFEGVTCHKDVDTRVR